MKCKCCLGWKEYTFRRREVKMEVNKEVLRKGRNWVSQLFAYLKRSTLHSSFFISKIALFMPGRSFCGEKVYPPPIGFRKKEEYSFVFTLKFDFQISITCYSESKLICFEIMRDFSCDGLFEYSLACIRSTPLRLICSRISIWVEVNPLLNKPFKRSCPINHFLYYCETSAIKKEIIPIWRLPSITFTTMSSFTASKAVTVSK